MQASLRTQLFHRFTVAGVVLTALLVGTSWERLATFAGDLTTTSTARSGCTACRDVPPLPSPGPVTTPSEREALLAQAPEVSLSPSGARERFARTGVSAGDKHPVLALFDTREDLRGLPVLRGKACEGLPVVATAARDLRFGLSAAAQFHTSRKGSFGRRTEELPSSVRRDVAFAAESHPMLLWQVCQCEPTDLRSTMTEVLRMLEKPGATEALARIALFDSAAEVRTTAVAALKTRSPADYRPVLLSGFQHVWPEAADNAATALAMLDDRSAVPDLIRLLDAPDPVAPAADEAGTPFVRELVRVNHGRNCQLCHAPSYDAQDTARAAIPSPDLPLPPSFSADYGNPCGDSFVRIDVTYLRPDFSQMLPVAKAHPWPARQRYDFLVRTRPATADELAAERPATFRQREAVLRVLQRLTGQTLGSDVVAWQRFAGLNMTVRK